MGRAVSRLASQACTVLSWCTRRRGLLPRYRANRGRHAANCLRLHCPRTALRSPSTLSRITANCSVAPRLARA
jgi:hypothetical protein